MHSGMEDTQSDSGSDYERKSIVARLSKAHSDLVDSIEDWSEKRNSSEDDKKELKAIMDRFTDEIYGEMEQLERINNELKCKWHIAEAMKLSQSVQIDKIVMDMGLQSSDDIVRMYTQLRSDVKQKNTLISDLMRHWKADIVADLFLIPNHSVNDSMRRNHVFEERESHKEDAKKQNGPRPDTRGHQERSLRVASKKDGDKKKKKKKKKKESSEDDSTSDSSSESDKKKRRRRKNEKKKKRSESSESESESEKEERRRRKARERLIRKLPKMEPYDGNQEGWKIFAKGFKIRYEDIDDDDGIIVLNEHLCGEASKIFRGLPKDIERKGWRKSLKWLKERIMGGTMYKMIDYERNLRHQVVNGRRVSDVCEEFTRWIHKLFEIEPYREDMKKRQLLLLYQGSTEYTRLLEMLDENASFEQMKNHLERKEYSMRISNEREESYKIHRPMDRVTMKMEVNNNVNNVKCYSCHEWGHKSLQCPKRENPSNPNERMVRSNANVNENTQSSGSNDVRVDQNSHNRYNQWEAKDRPIPKKDPEKHVMSIRVHPSMFNQDYNDGISRENK